MIEGKQIRLRAFEGTDAAANHEFVNDPETLRGMMSGIPFPSSYADEQQWLSQQSSYTRGEYQFAVETVDGDELAGRCGIIRVDWKNRMAKLAIMIGKPYRGKGYGKEAMKLLCDFCFREMNLHKLRVSCSRSTKRLCGATCPAASVRRGGWKRSCGATARTAMC